MIVGIDPGLAGAVACWLPSSGALTVHAMPTALHPRAGKKPIGRLNYAELFALIAALGSLGAALAILEDVHGRPTDGGVRGFNFGESKGALRMALVAAGIPYRLVAPATWKVAMAVPSDKTAARNAASQVFPRHSKLWPLVKDDGKAEAALLAKYGERLL